MARFIGLVAPLALTVVYSIVLLAWIPRLPNPMAMHWNGAGEADGFGSPWLSLPLFGVVGLVITSLYFATALQKWQAKQSPKRASAYVWGPINRLIPAIVLGTVMLIAVMALGTTSLQLGLSDAREMPPINPLMLASFAAAIVTAVAAYFVQPRLTIPASNGEGEAVLLPVADTERLVWVGEARASRGFLWFVGVTIALMVALTIWMFGVEPAAGWICLATLVLVVLLLTICISFRVRIDEGGLEARAFIGWPIFRVPAGDVKQVVSAHIMPMAEYGGWGLRWIPGATGIVLRTGEGIVVTRRNGKVLAITIDDSTSAAAVLATAAKRATENAND